MPYNDRDGNATQTPFFPMGMIENRFLEKFDPPKIVPDKNSEFDLNRECQMSLSRLNVALEANVVYQKKLLQRDYDSKRQNQDPTATKGITTLSSQGRVPVTLAPVLFNTLSGGAGGSAIFGSLNGTFLVQDGAGGAG